jgi:hypothetical protein
MRVCPLTFVLPRFLLQRLLLLQAELDAIASVVSQIDNTFNAQLKESSSLASVRCLFVYFHFVLLYVG